MKDKNLKIDITQKHLTLNIDFSKIIRESKKYNLIDRFFFYSVEEGKMTGSIHEQLLETKNKKTIIEEIEKKFFKLRSDLIANIKYCYGLHNIKSYIESDRNIIINCPSLLGISALLFSEMEWEVVIISEIKKSGYNFSNLYNLELMIRNCLDETLFRLDTETFNCDYGTKKYSLTTDYLFSIINDNLYETVKQIKSKEHVIKSIIKKNSPEKNSKVILKGNFTTGKLIEKFAEAFGIKSIRLTKEELNDIKSFVSINFKNSKGKNIIFREINNKSFFTQHKKLIKNILISNLKNINCDKKEIAHIINRTLPEIGELKTIENY